MIRTTYRPKSPQRLFESAVAAIGAAANATPSLYIVLFDEMEQELRRNLQGELARLQSEISKLKEIGRVALLSSEAKAWATSVDNIERSLFCFPDAWTNASQRINVEPVCLLRAKARLAAGLKPAKRGSRNVGDCLITEHLLELSYRLRGAGFSEDILFVSSNTKDYGELTPKAPLDSEFTANSIDLYGSIEGALSQLGF